MQKQTVIYRWIYEGEDSNVIAFFPGVAVNHGMCMSYEHVGQHGEASLEFYRSTRPIRGPEQEKERDKLHAELTSIYDDCVLVIKQRMPHDELSSGWIR